MIRIRPMTADNLPLALRLKGEAGWNQITEDWRRFLAMQPEGCLVAEVDGVAVGTAIVTMFDGLAWISMVLVDEKFRSRGVGKALMNRAVQTAEELGGRTIRLDATPLGQPLYESLGFAAQYELTRWAGVAGSLGASSQVSSFTLRTASPADSAAILALDRSATHTDRRKFLSLLFAEDWSAVRVIDNGNQLVGYFTIRRGSEAIQLGPCIAESDDSGSALLTDALHRYAGSRVYWDAPCSHQAACALASSAGLAPQRKLLRMCRGEEVNDDIQQLWASSGPELG